MKTPLWQKVKRNYTLDESERAEWKSWLKSQHSKNENHGIRYHHFMANRWGNNGNSDGLYFLGLQKLQMVTAAKKLKDTCFWKKSHDQSRQHIKKWRHNAAAKSLSSQSCGFASGHVWMWELDHNKSWAPKNGCFQTVMLGKTLGNPLGYKEFRPVNPKENQSWIFIGRTDAEAEAPILWPPDVKSWLIGKDPDAG